MGIDASVSCSCWRDGKAAPFERPELIADEGGPRLTVDYLANQELHKRFWDWRQTACAHPSMYLVKVRISNWSGFREFQAAPQ